MSFAVKVDTTGVKRLLGRFDRNVDAIIFRETRKAADEFLNRMRARARGAEGSGLRVRTGRLRQSFNKVLTRKPRGGVLLALFSAGTSYANMQEYGGLIRPKPPRKFLTIPIEDNLTRAGVPKYASAREFMEKYGGPRVKGQPDTRFRQGKGSASGVRIAASAQARATGDHAFIFTTKSGRKYIVLQKPNGEMLFLWKLVRQVVVPGRLRWNQKFNELSSELPDRIRASVSAWVAEDNAKRSGAAS
jgi:hypothetical protein